MTPLQVLLCPIAALCMLPVRWAGFHRPVPSTVVFKGRLRLIAAGCMAIMMAPAHALEGTVGRPITGMQVTPYAGVVPPQPGNVFSLRSIYYQGSLGGDVQAPIAGLVSVGLDIQLSYNMLSYTHIWDTPSETYDLASTIGVPFAWLDAEAGVAAAGLTRTRSESQTDLHDILLVPVTGSWHLSETDHLSASVMIFAPTGDYKLGRLDSTSLNVWTFIPTLAYTKLWPTHGFELSGIAAAEFYTKNSDTDYQNGEIFRLDFTAIKRFSNNLGIGIVGGWIRQVSDDEGGIAAELDGFRGRALGIGPIVTWAGTLGGQDMSFDLRWVNEFDVENRPDGDALLFNVSLPF